MFKSWGTSGSYFPSIPIGKNACANVLYVIQTHNSNESDFIDNSIELNKLNAKSAKINRIVRWSTIVLLNIYDYMYVRVRKGTRQYNAKLTHDNMAW